MFRIARWFRSFVWTRFANRTRTSAEWTIEEPKQQPMTKIAVMRIEIQDNEVRLLTSSKVLRISQHAAAQPQCRGARERNNSSISYGIYFCAYYVLGKVSLEALGAMLVR